MWLDKAIIRIEKFSAQIATLSADLAHRKSDPEALAKLQKKLTKAEEGLAEAHGAVKKYQQELGLPQSAPSEVAKAKAPTTVPPTKTEATKPTAQKAEVNGWPKAMVRLLDQWLAGRSAWNHGDWVGLLSQLSSAGFEKQVHCEPHLIGQYLETHRR